MGARMLEELANAYREACEEHEAALTASRALSRQQNEAHNRVNAATEKREKAILDLLLHIRCDEQQAALPVPPTDAK